MHFAAFSLVGESVEQPLAYYDNNVGKTTRLLTAMKEKGVSKFVLSSTAAVYGESARVPIEETDALIPTNPYGRTKLMIEQILEDAEQAYGMKYASLRYFNAAGAEEEGDLGCQTGYSVLEIIEIARRVTGHEIPAVEAERRPGDPEQLVASSARIRSELGWKPVYEDPELMIRTAWNWHRLHPCGFEKGK